MMDNRAVKEFLLLNGLGKARSLGRCPYHDLCGSRRPTIVGALTYVGFSRRTAR